MSLNFKARKSAVKNKQGKQLWFPVLVKEGGMVTSHQIARKIAEKSSLTPGDVYNVIDGLIGELNDKLMNGHSVKLDGLGSFTVIAKASGNGVETPEEVNSSQIKTLRIQFTPSYKRTPMQGITRAMYEGVEFRRWSGDPYNPKNQQSGNNNGEDNNPGGSGNEGGNIDPDA